jgi:Na+-transporting NADH:ubiquinone oxidoreductase subunit A
MAPTDVVWTVKAVDVVVLGRLFLDGAFPESRIISLGGSNVKPGANQHYRVRMGGDLKPLLEGALCDGEHRVVSGDVLSGAAIPLDSHLRLRQSALTVVAADCERHFMGWTMPGLLQMSFSRLFVSSWLPWKRDWKLGTNLHGEERALVLTGHYDKVMPLDIMVDFLIRAVMAGDSDEAISHGILETDPEDFALCDFVCPSKVEVQAIIRQGLEQIAEEGI